MIARMIRHRRHGRKWLANQLENSLQKKFGIYVSSRARIGESLSLPHPTGIVIGAGCIVGSGVSIYQNVTLGASSRTIGEVRYPQVGDNTTIYAGAVLVGPIKVGSECVIGANAVVVSDIPDGATAVGVPARIMRSQ